MLKKLNEEYEKREPTNTNKMKYVIVGKSAIELILYQQKVRGVYQISV